jgi:hypothetical protein
VPIEIARALYSDPVGKEDVRACGHCACPAPDDYGAEYFDADGVQLYSDPDGSEQRALDGMVARGLLKREDVIGRCVPDKRAAAVRVVVNCYHIDSEVGLRLFADALRGLIGDHPVKRDRNP